MGLHYSPSFEKKVLTAAWFVLASATASLADNPISSYHYLADPAAASDGETFYIIADSDDPAPDTDYDIRVLYAFSSKDMKNWTDYGIIFGSKREYPCHWQGNQEICFAANTWASGIGISKDGKFHIVFPDGGGGGIGLIEASSIEGPYVNPHSNEKKLINNWGGGFADCDGVDWCFDPAIFFDDDGTGYFTFGGGSKTGRLAQEGDNNIFTMYQFNSDNKNFDTNTKVQLKIGGPKAMEASYIHKKGSTYYLSYSTADLRIAYGTSSSPTGPYTYQGIFMDNPNINGANINANNNNHHGIAEFQGHWYVVYHDRRLVQADEHPKAPNSDNPSSPVPAWHRSVSIDEFTYSGDKMNPLTFTNEGPDQINEFNPYETYPALTSSKQRNIRSYTDWNNNDWSKGIAAKHVLTPYATKDSWIRISGVQFGKDGAKSFKVVAASIASDDKIEIRTGSSSGTLAGTCVLKKTENAKQFGSLEYYDVDRDGKFVNFEENECEVDGSILKNEVSELFLVFKGQKDTTMGILEWEFTCNGNKCASSSEVVDHSPYGGKAVELPGKIEAENYDVPGDRKHKSYYDMDSENQGEAEYRTDDAVDIVLGGSGKAIGYTNADEWLVYTVNVKNAGNYKLTVNAASSSMGSSMIFLVDDKDIGDTVHVDSTGEKWSVYQDFDAGTVELTTGKHIVKLLITGSFVNIDWFKFEALDEDGNVKEITDEPENKEKTDAPDLIKKVNYKANQAEFVYNVFDIRGNKIAQFKIGYDERNYVNDIVANLVKRPGFYLLKPAHGGAVKRIAITK